MADAVRDYWLLAKTWSRSAAQYPASLLMMGLVQFLVTGLDFVVVLILFEHLPRLGDFSLAEVAFLYGTSCTAFSLADLVLGTVERLGLRVRDGSLDVMLIRPASLLVQVAADQFSPRRLGKLLQSVAVLVWSITALRVTWTAEHVLLVPMMIGCGAVIYGAIWVGGSALQFRFQDGSEALNAFTYGGNFLTQYPLTIYGQDAMRLLTWVVPLAFVSWLPTLRVLDRDDPLGLPSALALAPPLVALVLALLASVAWGAGIRHYRSTGS